jgi:hypothetical protein
LKKRKKDTLLFSFVRFCVFVYVCPPPSLVFFLFFARVAASGRAFLLSRYFLGFFFLPVNVVTAPVTTTEQAFS